MAELIGRNRIGIFLLAAGLVAASPPAFAQADATQGAATPKTLAFDVVSIKPDKSETGPFTIGFPADGDGLVITNIPLDYIIRFAYDFERQDLISGMPDWTKAERYDIQTKVSGDDMALWRELSDSDRRVMLQVILADRFKLKVRREPKDVPIYALQVDKTGARMKEAKPGAPGTLKGPDGNVIRGMLHTGQGQFTAQDESMADLALTLSDYTGRQVIDQTGLTGRYDFTLQFAPEPGYGPEYHHQGSPPPPDAVGPSVFTAVQEQLGLKLEPAKASVEGLVIDQVERPAGN